MRRLGLFLAMTAAILIAAITGSAAADTASQNNEGNRLYNQKKYDEALKKYTDAQASKPAAPELHYNIGNVLFRKGEYAKAVEEYLRAQTAPDAALSQSATFNRGNALMAQGQLQEAVNAYIQALRSNPADQDAKRNLELALRLMQEQQKQQQQDSSKDQKDNQKKPPPQQPRIRRNRNRTRKSRRQEGFAEAARTR